MIEFKLPDLGEGVHEGQIVNVLVNEGDTIAAYQPMLEVETDKAAVEIPAPAAGVIHKLHVEAGQVVTVGQVLVEIDDGRAGKAGGDGEAAQPAAAREETAAARSDGRSTAAPRQVAASGAGTVARQGADTGTAVAEPPRRRDGPVPAAPVVRKLARELGVDLALVDATGPHGRVLREDVERFSLGHRGRRSAAHDVGPRAAALEVPAGDLPDFTQYGPVRREPAPQIRKTIARQMTRAWLNVPRVTHCDSADVTDLDRNRKSFNASLREGQARLTMTAIVLKAIAASLRSHPMLNCSYDADAGEVVYKEYVHLGVAVDTPRGLVVPVIRDVDRKTLPQIAADLAVVADRAREAKFEIADLRGATFTITNVGALGGSFVTPMVNFPEVGIMALGRASMQAVVRDGAIVPRLMLPLSLSFDHRVVDGADGARFTRDVIDSLENPLRLISA